MANFNLRPSIEADAAFIYEVSEVTMKGYVEAAGRRWAVQGMHEKCDDDARDPSTRIILVGEESVGVYAATVRDGALCIDMLFLLPHFQRRGIGSALVEQAYLEASRIGLPIRIQVITTNPAQAFWRERRFSVTERDDLFYTMQSAA